MDSEISEHNTEHLAWFLIVSSMVGLAFDIFQVPIFGEVGLGIVFTPAIGLILFILYARWKKGIQLIDSSTSSDNKPSS